ncbi:uncharacterized protein C3orf38 homolog [Acanthochromis polyacanthus]|uniref:uncharacterized protein C3orf38 homolog n=1 Tax=Acanthochromis polyacanthus TaxID=80966 RepID=UPI002234609F|nr:uncharacterized protein C3orf38 homolog [Acanthochromis polyacanthus]
MSGLSETERVGFKKILGLMTIPDLLSLSDTVTNKMIVVENTREAVETILSFTKNAEELLRRKKVQRELIFRYLAKEGVVMPPNSEKHQLVRRTLELWSSAKVTGNDRTGIEQMEEFLGAELVSLRLLALSRDERLLFSPNPEPCGLKALASPHGLVLVAVAGTIHRDEVCLGIFEQIFGLIRSPLDNNSWKIKSVNLKSKVRRRSVGRR